MTEENNILDIPIYNDNEVIFNIMSDGETYGALIINKLLLSDGVLINEIDQLIDYGDIKTTLYFDKKDEYKFVFKDIKGNEVTKLDSPETTFVFYDKENKQNMYMLIIAGIIIVILLYLIYRIIFKKENKFIYKYNEYLTPLQNHIYGIIKSTFSKDSKYFNFYNVSNKYKDYSNVYLYNNPLDRRGFAVDYKGSLYRNLNKTFTK